jgi:hypothetical protein
LKYRNAGPLNRGGARRRLAAATLLAAAAVSSACCAQTSVPNLAQTPDWSLAARQRLMGGSDAPMAQRQALLDQAEQQLAAGEAAAAQATLDRAAQMLHAPDTETMLVRAYMQAGDYRRALAFGAHAAGAHRREWPAGQALYVWLLQVGGQGVVARRLLDDALAQAPDDVALLAARAQLGSPWPRAEGVLLERPLTVAPYAVGVAVPASARVVGTAVLSPTGDTALLPSASLPGSALGETPVWLRNGLGHTVAARIADRDDTLGLVQLRLLAALPMVDVATAPRAPFGGSPGFMVEYAPSATAAPAWPLLRQGFFARVTDAPGLRPLGLEAPAGPRGGPVFNAAGQLAGLAVPAVDGPDRLVPVATFVARFPAMATQAIAARPAEGVGAAPARADADVVYERALRQALQVLVAAP